MSSRVAVVTDSTASLPAELVDRHGVLVVPLQVVIGDQSFDEGDTTPDAVATALRKRQPVSTSRPSPHTLLDAYQRAAKDGAEAIVSIHLSAAVSGTFESAQLAAAEAPVPVEAVDSRQVGMGTGFAVLSALRVLAAGGDAPAAAAAARQRVTQMTTLFYVDTMEYLRRGGASVLLPRWWDRLWRSSHCCRWRKAGSSRWRRYGRPLEPGAASRTSR
jgi:DegV family protein with EDD domain